MSQGVKFDGGKLPWDLLPVDALRAVVAVLAHGKEKYGARNWEKGMDFSRLYAAAQRHLTDAWWCGEDFDHESGQHHLAHAATDILMLLAYVCRDVGNDDRPTLARSSANEGAGI